MLVSGIMSFVCFRLNHISIIVHKIHRALCIQLKHFSGHEYRNMDIWSYYHHLQIGSMNHYPLLEVRLRYAMYIFLCSKHPHPHHPHPHHLHHQVYHHRHSHHQFQRIHCKRICHLITQTLVYSSILLTNHRPNCCRCFEHKELIDIWY